MSKDFSTAELKSPQTPLPDAEEAQVLIVIPPDEKEKERFTGSIEELFFRVFLGYSFRSIHGKPTEEQKKIVESGRIILLLEEAKEGKSDASASQFKVCFSNIEVHDLCPMSDTPKNGLLYVERQGASLKYLILNSLGKKKEGIISQGELKKIGISALPLKKKVFSSSLLPEAKRLLSMDLTEKMAVLTARRELLYKLKSQEAHESIEREIKRLDQLISKRKQQLQELTLTSLESVSTVPEVRQPSPISPSASPVGLVYEEVAMPKDGHCLYNAVGIYVGHQPPVLRGMVADELQDHASEYKDFITFGTRTLEEYVDRVRNTTEWAGDVEIKALMRKLRRRIIVIRPGQNPEAGMQDLTPEDKHYYNTYCTGGDPITVKFDGTNHYDALILREETPHFSQPESKLGDNERLASLLDQINREGVVDQALIREAVLRFVASCGGVIDSSDALNKIIEEATSLSLDLEALKPYLSAILEITSERGDTQRVYREQLIENQDDLATFERLKKEGYFDYYDSVLMHKKGEPPFQEEKRGIYFYRKERTEEIFVRVIHTKIIYEDLNLSKLASQAKNKDILTTFLKSIEWPTNQNSVVNYQGEIILFIKSKCRYAYFFQGTSIEKIEDLKKIMKMIVSHGGKPVKHDIIMSARDKDIVLILGDTGSGKSTLVNYLLGSKFEASRIHGRVSPTLLEGEKLHSEISINSAISQTSYPQIFPLKERNLVYCDLPGFRDNRDNAAKIVGTISTRAVINSARSIKAILLLVEYNSITMGAPARGEGLYRLAKSIKEFIRFEPEFAQVEPSILLVITKVAPESDEEEIRDAVEYFLNDVLIAIAQLLEKLTEQEIRERELKSSKAVIDFFRGKIQTLVAGNIFDDGETRQKIEEFAQNAQGIDKNLFLPTEGYQDKVIRDFHLAISGIVGRAIPVMEMKNNLPDQIETIKSQIQDQLRKMRGYEKIINLGTSQEEKEKMLRRISQDNLIDIENQRQHLRELQRKLSKADSGLRSVDRLDSVVYWREHFNEERSSLFGYLGHSYHDFIYDSIPYDSVDTTDHGGGDWVGVSFAERQYKMMYSTSFDGEHRQSVRDGKSIIFLLEISDELDGKWFIVCKIGQYRQIEITNEKHIKNLNDIFSREKRMFTIETKKDFQVVLAIAKSFGSHHDLGEIHFRRGDGTIPLDKNIPLTKRGYFFARYKTHFTGRGWANIAISVAMNAIPNNIKVIEWFKKDIGIFNQQIQVTTKKIQDLNREIGQNEESIQLNMNAHDRIGEIRWKIDGLQIEVESHEKKLTEANAHYENNVDLIEMTANIIEAMGLKSSADHTLIEKFLEQFNRLKSPKKGQDDAPILRPAEKFLCSFLGIVMLNPVTAECGHAFEHSMLLRTIFREKKTMEAKCPNIKEKCEQLIRKDQLKIDYPLRYEISMWRNRVRLSGTKPLLDPSVSLKGKPTRDFGDSIFHAVSGDWDEESQEYICHDVMEKRKLLSLQVGKSMPGQLIYQFSMEAIREFIRLGSDIPSSIEMPKISELIRKMDSVDQPITTEMVKEYAIFIGQAGQSLSLIHLELVALVTETTVMFYRDLGLLKSKTECYNPGASRCVLLKLNDAHQFQRLESMPIQSQLTLDSDLERPQETYAIGFFEESRELKREQPKVMEYKF